MWTWAQPWLWAFDSQILIEAYQVKLQSRLYKRISWDTTTHYNNYWTIYCVTLIQNLWGWVRIFALCQHWVFSALNFHIMFWRCLSLNYMYQFCPVWGHFLYRKTLFSLYRGHVYPGAALSKMYEQRRKELTELSRLTFLCFIVILFWDNFCQI